MEKVFVTVENQDKTKKVKITIEIDREEGTMNCKFVFKPELSMEEQENEDIEEYQHIAGLIFEKLRED